MLFCFRTHNNLYMPEMVARLGETFAKALDMLEVEKNAILGKGLLFRRNVWVDSQRYLRCSGPSVAVEVKKGWRASFFIVFAVQL